MSGISPVQSVRDLSGLYPLVLTTLLATAAAIAPTPAAAQSLPPARTLTEVRDANVSQDAPQAYLLLGWGITSLAFGVVEGIAGYGGDRARWFAVNTATWGLIDAVIALPWVLGTRRERAAVARDRGLSGGALALRRLDAISHSQTQQRSFAINAALDLVYIGGGIALWAAFDRQRGAGDFWSGAGMAALSQGLFLLVFDAAGWVLSGARTRHLRDTTE